MTLLAFFCHRFKTFHRRIKHQSHVHPNGNLQIQEAIILLNVRRMYNILNRAEEIILHALVYDESG